MGKEYLHVYTQRTRPGVAMGNNEDSEDDESEMGTITSVKLSHLGKSLKKMTETLKRLEQQLENVDHLQTWLTDTGARYLPGMGLSETTTHTTDQCVKKQGTTLWLTYHLGGRQRVPTDPCNHDRRLRNQFRTPGPGAN